MTKMENKIYKKNIQKNNKENSTKNNKENNEKNNSDIELGLYLIKEVFEENIEESKTKYIKGSVRSGNKIMYDGSLVILGDVNAGAEIIAGENIVIVGNLRGVAHAGAKGNKKAIVAAENIEAPQLRIANLLWENEENNNENLEIKKYAYVEDEKIKIINY